MPGVTKNEIYVLYGGKIVCALLEITSQSYLYKLLRAAAESGGDAV